MQRAGSELVFVFILSFIAVSRQATPAPSTVGPSCRRTVDLVFVLDGSNSLGSANFQTMIDTVSKAVDVLDFGEDKARVGAVLYSSSINSVIELGDDKAAFRSELSMFEYPDEATNTHLGIIRATEMLKMFNRSGIPSVLMLVTDGASSDKDATGLEALRARSEGTDVWAIGVTNLTDMDELKKLVSGPNQLFHIATFEDFPERLLNLTMLICENAVTRSTFTIPTSTTPPPSTPSGPTTESTTGSPPPATNTKDGSDGDGTSTNYKDLCKTGISIGGVGHVLFPGDCTKVQQCYHNPTTNKTLVVTRKCPAGQFWDPTCNECVASYKVDCPYDKCKTDSCGEDWDGMETYPMEGVCGGFWACNKERSYPKCCPPCHTYIAGYGCSFGTTCMDKCGPEESCVDGLGICDKIPLWDRESTYGIATSTLGILPTTCSMTNFSIIECGCQIRLMDIFMQGTSGCSAYHEIDMSMSCSSNNTQIPIKHKNSMGPMVWRISLNVNEPEFEIKSAPLSSDCDEFTKLRIWADDKGVHAQLWKKKRPGPATTVFFKGWTGEIEVLAMLDNRLLTLAVKKDNYQYVSMAKAPSLKFCSDCMHNLTIVTGGGIDCTLNKVQLYNCKPEVSDIKEIS